MTDFKSRIRKNWVLLVLAPALFFRLAVWLESRPEMEGRAMTYVAPALELAGGSYSGVETFRRTPGYPVFLAAVFAAAGKNAGAVTLAQHLAGLGTAYAVMRTALLLWGSAPAAAAAGLLVALNPSLIYYEGQVESETLSIFLLSVTVLLLVRLLLSPGPNPRLALLAGLAGASAALCRPEMAAFVLVPLPFLPGREGGGRDAFRFSLAFMAPLIAWMARNWLLFGLFTLSPMGAITSLQTSGHLVDWSAPPHAELKAIYSELLRGNNGSHLAIINEAVARRGRQVGFEEALKEGYRLGSETFREHPGGYLLATRANFRDYFRSLSSGGGDGLIWTFQALQEDLLALAALGFVAAALLAPGRGALMLALGFLCLVFANCLVEIGLTRRGIASVPFLSLLASYLLAAPAAFLAAFKAKSRRSGGRSPATPRA
jgi:hypothetical protein